MIGVPLNRHAAAQGNSNKNKKIKVRSTVLL